MATTCPVCSTGQLLAGADKQYWRCNHCGTEVARCLTPRPAEEYDLIEWYGHRWEFDLVAAAIPDGSRVLELGCGEGYFCKALLSKSVTYQGVDFNKEAILSAQAKIHKAGTTFLSRLEDAIAPSDTLCAFHVIEHIAQPQTVLRELIHKHQISKMYISVPSPIRATVRAAVREHWDHPPHHLYRFSERGLREMMERLGFRRTMTAFEPLRCEEVSAIAQARLPSWLPRRQACTQTLTRWLGRIPASQRPRLGQAMLMSFEKARPSDQARG